MVDRDARTTKRAREPTGGALGKFALWLGVVIAGVIVATRLGDDAARKPAGGDGSTGQESVMPSRRASPAEATLPELRSIAERSEYTRTASHEETVALLDALAAWRPGLLRRGSMGATEEGRDIPLLIAADPPVSNAAEAGAGAARGKIVVFAFGNIHAGEVEGKEALPMLARWLGEAPDAPAQRAILDKVILVLAPIFNGDGNERTGPGETNRPGQNGPPIVGVRPNASGLDLNRDYTKAEAAETRAMLRFFNEWAPHVVIDCHTTNGSQHRYTLTYEAPLTTAGARAPVEFARDTLLPDAQRRTLVAGYDTWWYGDFAEGNTRWRTYSAQARFGGNYHALRVVVSVLAEAYSYATYKDRTLCTLEFVRACVESSAAHAERIHTMVGAVRTARLSAGRTVALTHRLGAFPGTTIARGYDESAPGARAPKDYEVIHEGRFEPAQVVSAPEGYLLAPGPAGEAAAELLGLHGVAVEPVSAAARMEVESLRVTKITLTEKPFQGRRLATIEVAPAPETRDIGPGWRVVRADQPLGDLAVILLEPGSEDGMAAWGVLPNVIEGHPFPILRIRKAE